MKFLLAALTLLAGLVVAAPANAAPPYSPISPPPGAAGPFQIRDVYNDRCLDEPAQPGGAAAPNGTRLQLWDCYGRGQWNQQWYLYPDGRNRFLLINAWDGKCVDAVWNGGNGTWVVAWDCYYDLRNLNQLWYVGPNSQPTGAIWKDSGRVLDPVWQEIGGNGTRTQLWDNVGNLTQQWRLVYFD
ncbi:MAG: ricin-type beta-trefoil lectin domain protein [Catenulispora sp.]|nr:ricin-type beta-trefoil lectin domain protein [Catenulispora sp.]